MHQNLFSLKNKVIVLTGGLGLLGTRFTKVLANAGAIVYILDFVSKDSAQRKLEGEFTQQELEKIFYLKTDISKKSDILKAKNKINKKHKFIDVLINNAAINPALNKKSIKESVVGRFEDIDLKSWDRQIAVNLTGTMLCCQVFSECFSNPASIINLGSPYGVISPDQNIYPKGYIKPATYGVTKAGIINLTKYLAVYWAKRKIRVNCLLPMAVIDENQVDPVFKKKYIARSPIGRLSKPEDLDGIILYLSSDASAYATGSVFTIDGGWTSI